MVRRFLLPLMLLVLGAGLWVYATTILLGSAGGVSEDRSQTAIVLGAVPAWVGPMRIAGIALLLAGVAAGIAVLRKGR